MRSSHKKIPRPSEAEVARGRGEQEVEFVSLEYIVGKLERMGIGLEEVIGNLRAAVDRMKGDIYK